MLQKDLRTFSYLFVVLLLISCKNGKQATEKKPLGEKLSKIQVTEGCPNNGRCGFKVMPGKSYRLETDATGMTRPVLMDNPKTMVIKFVYTRNQREKQIDGQYREEVYAVIPATENDFEAVGKELKDIKMLFGRFCFCPRNSVGYVKVEQGRLKIENGQIRFRFKNEKLPQVIGEIAGKF